MKFRVWSLQETTRPYLNSLHLKRFRVLQSAQKDLGFSSCAYIINSSLSGALYLTALQHSCSLIWGRPSWGIHFCDTTSNPLWKEQTISILSVTRFYTSTWLPCLCQNRQDLTGRAQDWLCCALCSDTVCWPSGHSLRPICSMKLLPDWHGRMVQVRGSLRLLSRLFVHATEALWCGTLLQVT